MEQLRGEALKFHKPGTLPSRFLLSPVPWWQLDNLFPLASLASFLRVLESMST